jgi:hypothetical protein
MSGYNYGSYTVYPVGQQFRHKDSLAEKWMAKATIIREDANEVLAVPVSWYQPEFETEQDAKIYAAVAAKEMIDAGLVKSESLDISIAANSNIP